MRIAATILLLLSLALPAWPQGYTGSEDMAIGDLPDGGPTIQSDDAIPIARNGMNYRIAPYDILGRGLPITGLKNTVQNAGTCSTSVTIDVSAGNMARLNLNGACTIGVTNISAGSHLDLLLSQSWTTPPTFGASFKWQNGTAPTWSTVPGKQDLVNCDSYDGSVMRCRGTVDLR